MTAKEYLQTVYNIKCRIDRLNERRKDLNDDLYSYGIQATDGNHVQTSVSGDRLSELIAMADEVERKLVLEIKSLIQQKQVISEQIEALPNEKYRRVLFERYILCKRWEQIADGFHIRDVRWIYRLHGKALQLFAKEWNLTIERPL